jgi:LAO/AO transport system kinase
VGVTGPPGVGKSTLVAAVARALRVAGDTVGVLAIDPTSLRSGGALLGDRTRIAPDPADEGLFVRSLASAGELGGLAPSVPMGVLVLGAAFDVAIVETVGVGQSETDARHVVDTLVFVVQPGSGDCLQYMKAGVMEVPDVLVVNKGDLDLATRTRLELGAALGSLRAAGIAPRDVPLVTTCALEGTGIAELVSVLRAHGQALAASGELERRRRDGAIAWAMRAFVRRYGEAGVERLGGETVLRDRVREAIGAGREVLEIIDALAG